MELTAKEYGKLAKKAVPHSPALTDCLKAFVIGGGICVIGQLLTTGYLALGLYERTASLFCTVTLIFISVALTGAGLYDKIAKHAGAGTLVPITGFANAIASPAIEFKTEGFILGLSAKMFTIAGPVIVYGVVSGILYGLVYLFVRLL
ncbi:MAG: stage V sporulation protein AC [Clostridia bacterium]|nr:stage V sporulation protein AC [Clostridia bacterium]